MRSRPLLQGDHHEAEEVGDLINHEPPELSVPGLKYRRLDNSLCVVGSKLDKDGSTRTFRKSIKLNGDPVLFVPRCREAEMKAERKMMLSDDAGDQDI